MDTLIQQDVGQLQSLIRAREVSCVEVMQATLAQVEMSAERINAFALVDAEAALASAQRADAQLRDGSAIGSLHGVPFSVKDLIDAEGLETGYGSWLMVDNIASQDALAVKRLKDAGAILIGKTTTPEFAGSVLTESIRYGITRNPWDREHTSGGSSGGAAAAVASGCGPLGLATDGAGSARIPASCCGVLGLKPTLGRVPHTSAPDLFANFTHLGLITRSVADLSVMLNVLSGADDGDPWTLGKEWQPVAARTAPDHLTSLRAWYLPYIGNNRVATEVSELCTKALSALSHAGVAIDEHTDPFDWAIDTSRTIMRGLMSARMAKYNDDDRARMGNGMHKAIEEGVNVTAAAVKNAPILRSDLYRRVNALLQQQQLLISPVLSAPPPRCDFNPLGEFSIDGHSVGDLRAGWFTYPTPFNLTGHPAISIPVGFTQAGLPVGLQVVARWGQEQMLCDVASALHEHFPWQHHWPSWVVDAA